MSSGIEIMVAGMGIVFLFLAMLVVSINIMSSLVHRYFPDPTLLSPVARDIKSTSDQSLIAAITVAVHQYRSKYK
ncbi:OadG family protein [Candidatus Methylobacter favarea]|nr:OadG family protein [Candidatus Methylobacter favarea]